jgi:hypothetical protein
MFPYMVSAGEGSPDLKAILEQGRKSGVEHFFVEQDNAANPEIALRKSIDHLSSLWRRRPPACKRGRVR